MKNDDIKVIFENNDVLILDKPSGVLVLPGAGEDLKEKISLLGELKNGEVSEYEVHPEDFGLQMMSLRNLRVGSADESKAMLLGAFDNKPGAAREIVCLNAGAALYVANCADSIGDGIAKARESMASGAARASLERFVQCTQRLAAK